VIRWIKAGKTANAEGTTIEYQLADTAAPITIESRKRHIPHANGRAGTWDHTTYHVLYNEVEVQQRYSLRDAKAYAERLLEKS